MVPDGDKSSIVRSYSERNNVWQLDMSYTIDGFVRDISLSADGKYAVVGTSWGTSGLLLFDLDSTENHLIWTYGKDASSNLVSISKNGNYIVASLLVNESYITTLFYQQTVLWSLNEAEGSLNPTQIQISNDGNYILIGNSLFSKDSPTPIRSFDDEVSLSEGSLLLSDNGENILATGSEGNLYFFDRDSSSPLWIINLDSIHRYVISSDGKHVAVVTKMGDNYYVYFYEEGLNFTYLFGAGVLIFIVAGVIISRKVKQAG
jgi:hypothetical protein